jgi:hypothetical protein
MFKVCKSTDDALKTPVLIGGRGMDSRSDQEQPLHCHQLQCPSVPCTVIRKSNALVMFFSDILPRFPLPPLLASPRRSCTGCLPRWPPPTAPALSVTRQRLGRSRQDRHPCATPQIFLPHWYVSGSVYLTLSPSPPRTQLALIYPVSCGHLRACARSTCARVHVALKTRWRSGRQHHSGAAAGGHRSKSHRGAAGARNFSRRPYLLHPRERHESRGQRDPQICHG